MAKNTLFDSPIEIGKVYPLVFDPDESSVDGLLATLQYVFKPSSINIQRGGSMMVHKSNSDSVSLQIEGENDVKENFKGTIISSTMSPSSSSSSSFTDNKEYLVEYSEEQQQFKIRKIDLQVINLKLVREENLQRIKISASKQSKEFKDAQNFPKYLKTTIKPLNKKILSTSATATDVSGPCTTVATGIVATTGVLNTDTVPLSLNGVENDDYNSTIQTYDEYDDDVQVVSLHTIKESTSKDHTSSGQTLADGDVDPTCIEQATS
jgi:hypothetical protein